METKGREEESACAEAAGVPKTEQTHPWLATSDPPGISENLKYYYFFKIQQPTRFPPAWLFGELDAWGQRSRLLLPHRHGKSYILLVPVLTTRNLLFDISANDFL